MRLRTHRMQIDPRNRPHEGEQDSDQIVRTPGRAPRKEAAIGSLEFVLAAPLSRTAIAMQKVGAHLVALAIAMTMLGILIWASTVAFATLPGDQVPLVDALAAAWTVGLLGLVGGAAAFALSSTLGRGAALVIGAVVLVASYLVHSYASISPAFDVVVPLSYFGWAAAHRPLAGVTDWLPMAGVALLVVGLLAVGIITFDRSDIGRTKALPIRGPRFSIGLGGPFGRSLAERLPAAVG